MKIIYVLILFCAVCFPAAAQNVSLVFDVTSSDTVVQAAAIRHVKMMADAYPKSSFRVVIYSSAFPMILKDRSTVAKDVAYLANKPNVAIRVCAMTLKKHKLDEDELLDGVKTVPDGIMEIALKQQAGWAYIKEAN